MAELYKDRLTLGMEVASIHVILRDVRNNVPVTLASLWSPVWYSCIVDLHVDMCGHYTPTPLAPVLSQTLETCLQSLHLVGEMAGMHFPLCYDLGAGHSGQPKDLKLKHICCRQLDLESALCLTSISLKHIEMYVHCHVIWCCQAVSNAWSLLAMVFSLRFRLRLFERCCQACN